MSEYRFKQIRAAFHPESGVSSVSDKCHQLRACINSLNEHAKRAFVLGRECSFDEGGIASKSRYNPVRQYNSSKPGKYRIDFFVLVNTTNGINFIYHLDVYQGKNATNAHIAEEAWTLPTTQKAVVNAIVSSGISTDPDGMREIYMDNRYSAPELFVMLREKYQILAFGTVRSNRKGWDGSIMNLSKRDERGSSLVKYDPVNRILFGQWNDNKVVSFISTLGISGSVNVSRRVGANTVQLPIEISLKRYTSDNFMGGVDNVDKDKKIGGGFTKKALFKKWYRMGVLGIFDFMSVNGRVAWNMAANVVDAGMRRFNLTNWKFRLILSEEMIAFRDESSDNFSQENELANSLAKLEGHNPGSVPSGFRVKCCVCRLEEGFQSIFKKEDREAELSDIMDTTRDSITNRGSCSLRNMASCSNPNCSLFAHSICVASNNLVFKHPQLIGLTCFEIAHHPIANGLWKSNTNFQYNTANSNSTGRRQNVHSVSTDHPLYHYLRNQYGLDRKKRRRQNND